MNTDQIIKKATRQLDIDSEKITRLYFDTFISVISEELEKGNDVSLVKLGDFCLRTQYRGPRKNENELIGLKKIIRKIVFLPSKNLVDRINRW